MIDWIKTAALTVAGGVVLLVLIFGQATLGFVGIAHGMGLGWAIGALVLALVFRFTLPMTIGVYFGVTDVLGWHPLVAVLIMLPGLIFVIPGLIGAAFSGLRKA